MKKSSNRTPKYNLSTWMTDLGRDLDGLKLHQLTLPSTHNAGMDKKGIDGVEEGWIACQNDTFSFQLAQGVRVFDLRFVAEVISTLTTFYFHHNGRKSKRTLESLLGDFTRFIKDNYESKKNEILILNFHELTSFQEGETNDYTYFLSRLKSVFSGVAGNPKILPRQAGNLTLGEIRTQYPGYNIILASNKLGSDPLVWDDIPHDWIGQDYPSEQEIDIFIDKNTIESYKQKLRSLQVVRYEFLYGAIHMGDYINEKFKPNSKALINSNIINVDFFESSSIVPYCISANQFKADRLNDKVPPSQPTLHDTFWHGSWKTYFVEFNESTDNFGVDHYLYTLNGGEENKFNNQYTHRQRLELKLAPDAEYELKLYAVDMAGNRSEPMVKTLKAFDQPTGPGKPTSPTIEFTERTDKYTCGVLFQPSHYNVDHHVIEVYAENAIVDGNPVGKPVLSTTNSRWASGTLFDNLPNYDAYQIVVYAVNSFDLRSDYSIKRVAGYIPTNIPPTAPSNLKTAYDPINQQLKVTFTGGEAHVGIATHTLIVKTDIENNYEPFYSDNTVQIDRSLDYTLTLYATDQDDNQSVSITLTGNTKENGQYSPTDIREQTVLRKELTIGSTTWKGDINIAQYKIHLYDTKDVEGGESGEDGKIIGEPLQEVFYSGSELTYTFENLIPLKEYYVFVWGINAYGTEGGRAYNTNYTFMHGDPAWDQEYPTVPSNLLAIYTTWSGYLSVTWNASSDNFGIDHYVLIINDTHELEIRGNETTGNYLRFVKLDKNIDYSVNVYAVDINGNRSRTAWYSGDTSDKDTDKDLPNTPQIAEIARGLDDSVFITWVYVHGAAFIQVEIQEEEGGDNKQTVIALGGHISIQLWNIRPDRYYTVTVSAVNSYLGIVASRIRRFKV